MSTLLEIKNVSKIYGDLHALDNVSLTVEKGEWIAIMGPSGSGKSTMMNIIGGLDRPTSGQVIFDGEDLSKISGRKITEFHRDKIGLVFQQFHLINYLTVDGGKEFILQDGDIIKASKTSIHIKAIKIDKMSFVEHLGKKMR